MVTRAPSLSPAFDAYPFWALAVLELLSPSVLSSVQRAQPHCFTGLQSDFTSSRETPLSGGCSCNTPDRSQLTTVDGAWATSAEPELPKAEPSWAPALLGMRAQGSGVRTGNRAGGRLWEDSHHAALCSSC